MKHVFKNNENIIFPFLRFKITSFSEIANFDPYKTYLHYLQSGNYFVMLLGFGGMA